MTSPLPPSHGIRPPLAASAEANSSAERQAGGMPGSRQAATPSAGDLLGLDAERRAALVLSNIQGIGPATLRALKAAFHSLAQALEAPRADLLACLRTPMARAALLAAPDFAELAQSILDRLHGIQARPIFPSADSWPVQIGAALELPILYVRGKLSAAEPRLAVVGARHVDAYGLALTRFWAGESARKGIAIVSGGARGVDSQAHRAALDVGGTTLAVLGTGIDRVYPPENAALFERIVEGGGALISQFPLGTPPLQRNFIQRNALIAALSEATIVTRAGPDSGALTTARAARQLGRSVFALPGDLTSSLSWGAQQLIESGLARPLSGLEPIGRLMNVEGPWPSFFPGKASSPSKPCQAALSAHRHAKVVPELACHARPTRALLATAPLPKPAPPAPLPPLEEKILNVFNGLTAIPRQFDELLSESELDAAGLADALLRLELLGLCEERPGRFFRRASPDQGARSP